MLVKKGAGSGGAGAVNGKINNSRWFTLTLATEQGQLRILPADFNNRSGFRMKAHRARCLGNDFIDKLCPQKFSNKFPPGASGSDKLKSIRCISRKHLFQDGKNRLHRLTLGADIVPFNNTVGFVHYHDLGCDRADIDTQFHRKPQISIFSPQLLYSLISHQTLLKNIYSYSPTVKVGILDNLY